MICHSVCNKEGFPYTYKELHSLMTIANESLFEFDNQLYRQIDGVSMGNPLAPLLADFFMGNLEQNMFKEENIFYPVTYFRYVDDTLCIFHDEEKIDTFLQYLNRQHPNIKFTVEKPCNNTLPFLDIKLNFDDDIISTEVYRKVTFTGRLLHFKSIVPTAWKKGLISTLVHRAYQLSSDWLLFHKEIQNLVEILTFNGYPKWWLTKAVKSFLNNRYKYDKSNESKSNAELNYIILKVPYTGKPSEILKRNINRILRRWKIPNIKICFVIKRLRGILPIKNKTSTFLRSSIVYKFQCSADPNVSYIGETGRQLIRRVKDHTDSNTAVTQHIQQCQICHHNTDTLVENFSVLAYASTPFERAIKEALLIKRDKPYLNTQHVHGKKPYCLQMF